MKLSFCAVLSGVAAVRQVRRTQDLLSVKVTVDDLEFDCLQTRVCGNGDAENVLLVHGFPERKEFWVRFMGKLGSEGYCGTACDMHGYSPGAAPVDQSRYLSDRIRSDTFEIAVKVGYDRFHLVTHDHGSILGWQMANNKKIISFTASSVPHVDAFSDALYGPNADVWQQVSSQYFHIWTRENSASLKDNFWFNYMHCRWGTCFDTPDKFQKIFNWYNGVFTSGGTNKLAMPPAMSVDQIMATDSPYKGNVAQLRGLFGEDESVGYAQGVKVGSIYTPTLFVCGGKDDAIFCASNWSKTGTAARVKGPYEYKEVNCGHIIMDCGDEEADEQVDESILTHIKRTGKR